MKLWSRVIGIALLLPAMTFAADEPTTRTITESYQNWEVVCLEREGKTECESRQILVNEQRQTVAAMLLNHRSDTGTVVRILLPHMLDLRESIEISFDEKNTEKQPYRFCNASACFVVIEKNDKFLQRCKLGTILQISAKNLNGETIRLNFSLNGFSGALNRISK